GERRLPAATFVAKQPPGVPPVGRIVTHYATLVDAAFAGHKTGSPPPATGPVAVAAPPTPPFRPTAAGFNPAGGIAEAAGRDKSDSTSPTASFVVSQWGIQSVSTTPAAILAMPRKKASQPFDTLPNTFNLPFED